VGPVLHGGLPGTDTGPRETAGGGGAGGKGRVTGICSWGVSHASANNKTTSPNDWRMPRHTASYADYDDYDDGYDDDYYGWAPLCDGASSSPHPLPKPG
jgi:hypothetical protein